MAKTIRTKNDIYDKIDDIYNRGGSDKDIEQFISNVGFDPGEFLAGQQEEKNSILDSIDSIYESGGTDSDVEKFFIDNNIDPSEFESDKVKEDAEFTSGEKSLVGGLEFATPIAGSIAGAKLGAAIGTAAAPGVGTAIGGAAGALIGGAGAAFGARFLGDELAEQFGAEERVDTLERAKKEALIDAGITAATLGTGKLLKGPISKGLKASSKDIRKAKSIQKLMNKSNLAKNKLNLSIQSIKTQSKKVKGAIDSIHSNIKDSSAGSIKKLSSKVNDLTGGVSKKIATASNDSLRALGKEYDALKNLPQSKDPLDMTDTMSRLSTLSRSNDPLILSSTSKVDGLMKKINKKGEIDVKDGLTIRQSLSDLERKLFNRGGEAAGLADEISDIRKGLDSQLDEATGGVLTDLNKRYREVINLSKANKLFSSDLIRAGNVGIEQAAQEIGIGVKAFAKEAAATGEDFFKKTFKDMEKAAATGEPLFNVGKKNVLKITNQSKILRATKIPELIDTANAIDTSLVRIAKTQMSKEVLEQNLKDLGTNPESAKRIANNISEELKANPKLKSLFKSEKLMRQSEKSLSETLSSTEKDLLSRNQLTQSLSERLSILKESANISEDLLGVYIAGSAAGDALTSVGAGAIAAPIKAGIGLLSISKWAPVAANTLEPIVKKFGDTLLRTGSVKNEVVQQLLLEIGKEIE